MSSENGNRFFENLGVGILGSVVATILVAVFSVAGLFLSAFFSDQSTLSIILVAFIVILAANLLALIVRLWRRKKWVLFHIFYSIDDVKQQIHDCRDTACLWGTTYKAYIHNLEDFLKVHLNNRKITVKFLLIKPNSKATEMAAFRAGYDINDELAKQEKAISDAINILDRLVRLGEENNWLGRVEYKVVDYLAPYTMYIFDQNLPTGYLHAHLSTFRADDISKRPTFYIKR